MSRAVAAVFSGRHALPRARRARLPRAERALSERRLPAAREAVLGADDAHASAETRAAARPARRAIAHTAQPSNRIVAHVISGSQSRSLQVTMTTTPEPILDGCRDSLGSGLAGKTRIGSRREAPRNTSRRVGAFVPNADARQRTLRKRRMTKLGQSLGEVRRQPWVDAAARQRGGVVRPDWSARFSMWGSGGTVHRRARRGTSAGGAERADQAERTKLSGPS